jgi:hypothetical protein
MSSVGSGNLVSRFINHSARPLTTGLFVVSAVSGKQASDVLFAVIPAH